MIPEPKIEPRRDPDGTGVIIYKYQLASIGELMELTEHIPVIQPEESFLRKMRVIGRPNGQRLQVLLVFEFYRVSQKPETHQLEVSTH
jgi:hypothetical protein